MTMKPQTPEELSDYAAQLKQQVESGALVGAELEAKIAELCEWANDFQEHADTLRRHRRQRQYPRVVRLKQA